MTQLLLFAFEPVPKREEAQPQKRRRKEQPVQLTFEFQDVAIAAQRKNMGLPEYKLSWEAFMRATWLCDEAIIQALSGKVRRKRWLSAMSLVTQWLKKNWKNKYLPQPVHLAAWRAGIVGLEAEL